jgi:hypothetical protein
MFLSVLSVVINQKFINMMKDTKLSQLKLEDELKEGTGQETKYKEFLDLFKDTDLRTTLDVIEALPKIIDRAIKQENEKKKLEDIKIKYLNGEEIN